eukprot:4684042-Heterocapsa_arctica.AAC.1
MSNKSNIGVDNMNIVTYFCRKIERQWATWIWITEGDLEQELKRPGDERQRVDYTVVAHEQHHRRQERLQDVDETFSGEALSRKWPEGSSYNLLNNFS